MRGGVGGDCWAYWVIMSSHWNFIQELREGLGKPGRMVRATRPWVGLRAKARPRARPPGCSGRGVLAPRLLIRHPALHPWGCALLRVMHAFAPSFPLGAPVWGPETSFGGGGGGQSSVLAEPGAQPGSGAPLGLPQAPDPRPEERAALTSRLVVCAPRGRTRVGCGSSVRGSDFPPLSWTSGRRPGSRSGAVT